MNLRTIPRTAVSTSITLARIPADIALSVLPGEAITAKLALERVDGTTRLLAGTLLGDPVLRDDGRRRNAAAAERRRAAQLRAQAAQTSEVADEQLEERHRQAERRRQQADARAHARRDQAAKRRKQRSRRAAEEEQQRRQASRRVEAKVEQQIEEEAPAARLEALDHQAVAAQETEQALIEADEAKRLEQAAERVKEERKEE